MRAQLHGILEGMSLAWEKGSRKFCIQSNSKVGVSLIADSSNLNHRHASLIEKIIS
ncbi:hypothetical protein LINPERPRIM_LOCUS37213 [Linum perenne]